MSQVQRRNARFCWMPAPEILLNNLGVDHILSVVGRAIVEWVVKPIVVERVCCIGIVESLTQMAFPISVCCASAPNAGVGGTTGTKPYAMVPSLATMDPAADDCTI